MQALVIDGHLRFEPSRPEPAPKPGDALLGVRLAGICATDLEIARGYMGFRGVPGHEFVADVLEGPPALKGKRVVAEINCVCRQCDMCTAGLSSHCRRRTVVGILGRDGAFAQRLAVPAVNCHTLPDSLSDEHAVFVEPVAAAFQILRQVRIEPRTSVALLGTGRLGLLIAQVIATTGCRLTCIGRNPRTLAILDRKGIRTQTPADVPPRQDHDVVIECTGSPEGLPFAARLVRPRGTIVLKTTCAAPITLDLAPIVVNEVSIVGSRCGPFPEAIAALAQQRVDVAPLISATLPLAKGVEAFETAAKPETIKVLLKPGT